MSPSLYGFVKSCEPVSPEEVASDFLSLENPNGDARAIVERLVGGDPRFGWEDEVLRTVDPASLALEEAPYVVFDVETTGPAAGKGGAITEFGALKVVHGEVVEEFSTLVNPGRPIDPFVVRLTGITDRMVSDAPSIGPRRTQRPFRLLVRDGRPRRGVSLEPGARHPEAIAVPGAWSQTLPPQLARRPLRGAPGA